MVKKDTKIIYLIFIVGCTFHLLYLFLLTNLSPIEQWKVPGDAGSYLRPAKTFIERGEFLNNDVPDYIRTIGYPFFLSIAYLIANKTSSNWFSIIFGAQVIVFALAYPAIFYIGRYLFGLDRKAATICVALTLLSGAYVSNTSLILSDALFATCLMIGIAVGIAAIKNKSYLWALLHVFFIIYAAQVRPMLAFFPFAALLTHYSFIYRYKIRSSNKITMLILIMFVMTLIGVQLPAARNWANHNVFTPTEIGSINLFEYLAKDVLRHQGRNNEYKYVQKSISRIKDSNIADRIFIRKREAINVFREHPLITLGLSFYNMVLNSMETHWQNFFLIFNKTWYKDYEDGSVKWAPIPFLFALFFVAIYGNVYLLLGLFLYYKRGYLIEILAVLIFMIPYVFCATSYQGARFRLWFEPMIWLFVVKSFQDLYKNYKN